MPVLLVKQRIGVFCGKISSGGKNSVSLWGEGGLGVTYDIHL